MFVTSGRKKSKSWSIEFIWKVWTIQWHKPIKNIILQKLWCLDFYWIYDHILYYNNENLHTLNNSTENSLRRFIILRVFLQLSSASQTHNMLVNKFVQSSPFISNERRLFSQWTRVLTNVPCLTFRNLYALINKCNTCSLSFSRS